MSEIYGKKDGEKGAGDLLPFPSGREMTEEEEKRSGRSQANLPKLTPDTKLLFRKHVIDLWAEESFKMKRQKSPSITDEYGG